MYLMLDVFAQHVAVPPSFATSSFVPPGGYGLFSDPSAFHPFCWIRDYDNATECESCWLGEGGPVALADLNTEKEDVVRELYDWIQDLVEDYGVDVVRVDTVKHGRCLERARCGNQALIRDGPPSPSLFSPQIFLARI
jgi:alpha-amylase